MTTAEVRRAIAIIDATVAGLLRQRAELAALVDDAGGIPGADRTVLMADAAAPTHDAALRRWLSLKAAACLVDMHRDTMERHARKRGLGRKVGGRWRIDPERLEAWHAGRPFIPIDAGDVSLP